MYMYNFFSMENHTKTFNELKKHNCKYGTSVLKYYDPSKSVILSVDASLSGLGAAILQDNLSVIHALWALSSTESSYAQVEKEMLAIIFGCVRFHQYIYYDKEIVVESDHKPLVFVINNAQSKGTIENYVKESRTRKRFIFVSLRIERH